MEESRKKSDELRQQLLAKIDPLLTDEQQKKLGEKLTTLMKDQADQARQLVEKMNALREKTGKEGGDPAAQKELDELRAKTQDQFRTSIKSYTDAIGELLTPEQKQKFEEAQGRLRQGVARFATDGLVRRAERTGLNDQQKQKVRDLAKAAQDAMDKLKPEDSAGRDELQRQLQKDIEAVLTDEQKTKFQQDSGGRFGRFGGGRRGAGPQGPPANPAPAPGVGI